MTQPDPQGARAEVFAALADEHCGDTNGCHEADAVRAGEWIDAIEAEAVARQLAQSADALARLEAIEHAARDVDGMWEEANHGTMLVWLPETAETLLDLRALLASPDSTGAREP